MIATGATPDRARRTVAGSVRFVLLSLDLGGRRPRSGACSRRTTSCAPTTTEMGGYRLDSSGLSGERLDGRGRARTSSTALNPLLEAKVRGFCSPRSSEPWNPTVVAPERSCAPTSRRRAATRDQDPWLQMLAEYDRIVAREVSMHGGRCRVVRPVRNGYLLVFEQAEERRPVVTAPAVRGRPAQRAGRPVPRSGRSPSRRHNIALGYGRSRGSCGPTATTYIGGAIDECIDLAARLRDGLIAMIAHFADQYEGTSGNREFAASTGDSPACVTSVI